MKTVSSLVVMLFLVLGAAIVLSTCEQEDDDGNVFECDIACYRSEILEEEQCGNQFWDCLIEIGENEECWNSRDMCYDEAYDAARQCAETCDDCLWPYFLCLERCPEYEPGECPDNCRYDFYNCAEWFDEECIANCWFKWDGCYLDHLEARDYENGHWCEAGWADCVLGCL